jgi:prepilin-type N-terminal cleavage/methylation domain-containing protein
MAHNNRGFTLLEVLVCVVIIGILAALAIPMFSYSTMRAKQREAMLVLKQIYVMQMAYFVEHEQYFIPPPGTTASASNPLALAPIYVGQAGSGRYSYSVESVGTGFVARAVCSNLDSDPAVDEWVLNDRGVMASTSDDAEL